MEREGGGEESTSIPLHQEGSRVEDQVLPFQTRHHLCRQEVAPAGSQKLGAQNPAPARRCGTKGKTRNQGREGRHGDRNRDGGGDENDDKYGNEHNSRDGGGNGSGNGGKNRDEGEGRVSMGTYEVVITEMHRKAREGGTTSTSDQ